MLVGKPEETTGKTYALMGR